MKDLIVKRLLLVLPFVLVACTVPSPQAAPTSGKSTPAAQPTPAGSSQSASEEASEPSESDSEDAPVQKSCELLPQAEAKKLAGIAVQEGMEGPENSPGCTYTSSPNGPTAQVELYLGDGAKKIMEVDREIGHDFADVPGVGDEAASEDNAIFFRVGKTWAAIRLLRLDNEPADNVAALKAAAGKVAGRM